MSQPCESAQLLQQPVRSLFFRYFRSNLVSSLMLAVYVLFDTIFIGWGIGSQGLAALNITLPCYSLEIGFAQMMGMGGSNGSFHLPRQGRREGRKPIFYGSGVYRGGCIHHRRYFGRHILAPDCRAGWSRPVDCGTGGRLSAHPQRWCRSVCGQQFSGCLCPQ